MRVKLGAKRHGVGLFESLVPRREDRTEQGVSVKHGFESFGMEKISPYRLGIPRYLMKPVFGLRKMAEHLRFIPVVRHKDHAVGHGVLREEFVQW